MPPGPVIQVRVTEEQLAWVDAHAEALGVTKSAVMKIALKAYRLRLEMKKGVPQEELGLDPEPFVPPKPIPPPPPKAYPREPTDCPHTYRNPNGICWACGEKGRVR